MSINKRIKEFRKVKGFSQQGFAKLLGVTRQTISNVEHDKHSASSEVITRLLQQMKDLNARWLILGEGEMDMPRIDIAHESKVAYEAKYKDKLINSLERENKLLQEENERLKKEIPA